MPKVLSFFHDGNHSTKLYPATSIFFVLSLFTKSAYHPSELCAFVWSHLKTHQSSTPIFTDGSKLGDGVEHLRVFQTIVSLNLSPSSPLVYGRANSNFDGSFKFFSNNDESFIIYTLLECATGHSSPLSEEPSGVDYLEIYPSTPFANESSHFLLDSIPCQYGL